MPRPSDGAVCDSTEVNNSIFGSGISSKSHKRSRCMFWETAIRKHLGSYLVVIDRLGDGAGKDGVPRTFPLIVLFSPCPQRKTLLSLNP